MASIVDNKLKFSYPICMRLPLSYYGDPILRKKAKRVDKITDEIRTLVENMIETMNLSNGIGLAAPQVHESITVFVTCAPIPVQEGEQTKWEPGKLRVFINPKLSYPSSESWEYSEGCLSIPGVYGSVIRPWKITVEAEDLEGKHFVEEFSGLDARVIMHENDHINGVLLIDRLTPEIRRELEAQLREIKKKYHH